MQRELTSLETRKAFERTTLPAGRKAIGVRWTYDYKYHPDGSIIRGKEKACLVAQGFSQRVKIKVISEKKVTRPGIEQRTFPLLGGCSTN